MKKQRRNYLEKFLLCFFISLRLCVKTGLRSYLLLLPLTLSSQEITIGLDTEKQLIPVEILPFVDDHSGLSKGELKALEKVFRFDFDHNGTTVVKPEASYQIEITLQERKLTATISSKETNSQRKIEGIVLSGDLSKDRKIIHLLSDTIYSGLFDEEGVASTRILYTVRTKNASEVWESDYDGGNPRQVIRQAGYAVTPAYIPPKPGSTAGSFFYVSYQSGQPKLFLASLNDGIGRRFTSIKGNQLMPAISRQRDHVAFICDVSGTPDLFLQQFSPDQGAIGKPRQLYKSSMSSQGSPTFSPDGKKIAFVSDKDGSARIYVMKIPPPETQLKDIRLEQITTRNQESTAPSWSPDGKKLAYCARTNGIRQIWVYDFDTKTERQLTNGGKNKENPSWAPNSTHLIYNTTDPNDCELYLTNINHPRPIKITSGPGEKRFPVWEPRSQ